MASSVQWTDRATFVTFHKTVSLNNGSFRCSDDSVHRTRHGHFTLGPVKNVGVNCGIYYVPELFILDIPD